MTMTMPGPMALVANDLDVAIAEDDQSGLIRNINIDERMFGIRLADTEQGRSAASMLISRMYASRGYQVSSPLMYGPNRITLAAAVDEEVMGTITLGIDSSMGVLADEIFKDQIDTWREKGARVCEITKLAIDPQLRSKRALAALFHTLFIYARYLYGCTDMFIEVNPRHRRFYESMLGFTRLGALRHNTRVDAPAYLLHLCLEKAAKHIDMHSGTSDNPDKDRSLYPYFFSKKEEQGIAHRLFNITWSSDRRETTH